MSDDVSETGWWWLQMEGKPEYAFMLPEAEMTLYRKHGPDPTDRPATAAEVSEYAAKV
jgi:hypothetical protein